MKRLAEIRHAYILIQTKTCTHTHVSMSDSCEGFCLWNFVYFYFCIVLPKAVVFIQLIINLLLVNFYCKVSLGFCKLRRYKWFQNGQVLTHFKLWNDNLQRDHEQWTHHINVIYVIYSHNAQHPMTEYIM